MKKLFSRSGIVLAIILAIGLSGCNGLFDKFNNPTKKSGDPELILKALNIFNKDVKNYELTVENDISKIEAKNIKAFFDYGDRINQELPVILAYKTGNSLQEGKNILILSVVPVKGKYLAWKKEITVIREESKDPKLTLSYLKVFDEEATDLNNLSFNVDNNITSISSSNVVAKFNYGNKTDELISVMVENRTLNEGSNTIRLSVEGVNGKYKAWNAVFSIKRMYRALILEFLSVYIDRSMYIVWRGMNLTNSSLTVPNSTTEITSNMVHASFKYYNGESAYPDLIVENGKLAVGKNIVKLSFPEFAGSEYYPAYQAWSMDLTVIRNGLPDNSLVSVTPPQEGIVGSAVKKEDFPFAGNYGKVIENFQGVFIEGRTVILSPFNIAETETTYKLWKEVYDWATDEARGENKYTFANPGKKGGSWEPPYGQLPPPNEVSELEPVTKISWYDCVVWCNAYTEKTYGSDSECVYRESDSDSTVLRDSSKLIAHYGDPYFDKTKKGFRLPTEAEWEYAARVQSDGTLCPLTYMSGAMGTCVATSNEYEEAMINNIFAIHVAFFSRYDKTSAVKCKAANALGLYDMSGNVY